MLDLQLMARKAYFLCLRCGHPILVATDWRECQCEKCGALFEAAE